MSRVLEIRFLMEDIQLRVCYLEFYVVIEVQFFVNLGEIGMENQDERFLEFIGGSLEFLVIMVVFRLGKDKLVLEGLKFERRVMRMSFYIFIGEFRCLVNFIKNVVKEIGIFLFLWSLYLKKRKCVVNV